jgi:hypothetical protein
MKQVDPQILGITLQNSFAGTLQNSYAGATWRPVVLHPSFQVIEIS